MQASKCAKISSVSDLVGCILESVQKPEGHEILGQRSYERYPLHLPIDVGRCRIDGAGMPVDFSRFCRAWMIDISMSGVGILVSEPWQIDDIGRLWINVQAIVPHVNYLCGGLLPILPRYCVKMLEHTYRVGCEFDVGWTRKGRL